MRAICPNCEAVYELPAQVVARLPASLRCARCEQVWEVQPEAEPEAEIQAEPEAVVQAEPQAEPETAASPDGIDLPSPPARQEAAAVESETDEAPASAVMPVPEPAAALPAEVEDAGGVDGLSPAAVLRQWIVSLVLLTAIIGLLLALHGPIGRVWPPAVRLYRLLGLG